MPRSDAHYSFSRSTQAYEEAKQVFAGGAMVTRQPLYPGEYPVFFARAKGCRAWDVDGNEFIDLFCSIGPIICGYADDGVDAAAIEQIKLGGNRPMNPPLLIDLSRKLVEMIPSAELVRLFKTGSEATHLAARTARVHTGKDLILRCGYHGWYDVWMSGGDRGVPMAVRGLLLSFGPRGTDGPRRMDTLPRNADLLADLLSRHTGQVAAVILCPSWVYPFTQEHFRQIADLARQHEAVLIFDEIKTGFRSRPGGVQELFGVTPDLTTLSKAMANGYPISALVGRRDVMMSSLDAGAGGTFCADAIAMGASLAALDRINELGWKPLWRVGQRLIDGLNGIAGELGVPATAYPDPIPAMPTLRFDYEDEATHERVVHAFYRGAIARGVFMVHWHMLFMNYSHTDADIDEVLNRCRDAMKDAASQV
ncbi:MAG: aminotransferase class III-fold pyridoxal phosphate-dependent enzyme [Armatimonadota bacterium]|jgi:glutamate-1-semialdehyde aminotransferase